jgi:hypothetical protein
LFWSKPKKKKKKKKKKADHRHGREGAREGKGFRHDDLEHYHPH